MSKIWVMIKDWIDEINILKYANYLRGYVNLSDNDISDLTTAIKDKLKEALREAGVDPKLTRKVLEKLRNSQKESEGNQI